MNKMVFAVKVPMAGNDYFELCRCKTAEGAAAVVLALMNVRLEFGIVVVIEAVVEI